MAKTFYTEKDIDELEKRGVKSLEISEDVVLTVLAYEKANKIGLQLIQNKPFEMPGAPIRPYISALPRSQPAPLPEPASPAAAVKPTPPVISVPPTPVPAASGEADLQNRIRSAVIARLGSEIDSTLLDNIIQRVLTGTGLK
jgi:hypothetical protein